MQSNIHQVVEKFSDCPPHYIQCNSQILLVSRSSPSNLFHDVLTYVYRVVSSLLFSFSLIWISLSHLLRLIFFAKINLSCRTSCGNLNSLYFRWCRRGNL
ncbi:unnamed protein product [Amoebophrya sp. A25]|nr:unnamed protein product [Amoebophrya sp. A25]|eukprot:GSA25T00012443001.1